MIDRVGALVLRVYFQKLQIDFFFFKQKTAYEMRISDWSSDVCSSDLTTRPTAQTPRRCSPARHGSIGVSPGCSRSARTHSCMADRSEEHTSELQSLMRISYAVFCLKKKITQR